MGVCIRRAAPEEAGVLSALAMRSKRSNGYDDAFMEACRAELTLTRDDFLTRAYWVAEAGEICGVIGLGLDADGVSGEVCSLFIDPDWKRQGIGRQLWQKVAEQAAAQGVRSVRLEADPAAVAFYEALGFRTVRMVPSESIPGRFLPQMLFEFA